MRNTLTGITLAAALLAPQLASADFLSIYAGVEGWRVDDPTGAFGDSEQSSAAFNLNNETAAGFYVGFEHPIPLIPNVKLRRDSIDTEGQTTSSFRLNDENFTTSVNSSIELQQTDVIIYWELLDLDIASFDFGINAKHIDLDLKASDADSSETEHASGWIPMAYASAEVGIPGLPLSVWAEGSYIGYSDNKFYDARAAIKYTLIETLPMDLTLSVGYRALVIDTDDLDNVYANLDFSGSYAGLEVRF
ncbi:MAG: TIGR04219 family outer membrane beta-barrel protein [Motiliproteus sp.]